MLATYASFLAVLVPAALVGQAVLFLSGRRRISPLAPAVGLAALLAIAWATVRLPGEGAAAASAIGVASVAALALLRGRVEGAREELGPAIAVTLAAALAASLPFIVEGRFGILGTGLNPDMSQHLLATDRLAGGGSERLIEEGYPLGPHALVVALGELGPGLVQAFDGLMVAIVAITALSVLGLLAELPLRGRLAGALLVALAYLLASNHVQGAFKESLEALFVLAFAIGLLELVRGWRASGGSRPGLLEAVPLAVLAIGAAYAYSFPGIAWLIGVVVVWAAIELLAAARRGALREAVRTARLAVPPVLVALGVLVAATLPELGRMLDFADFETFDPDGEGLGNLFDRISPLEALGIWPSGDFRVEPGDGAAPAIAFYLGAGFGLGALAWGLARWRGGDRAVPAALGAAGLLWLFALVVGTPYQEAKALVILAPLVALISVRALFAGAPALLALAFVVAAGGSSALALVNGPVGPSGYSTELHELAGELGDGSIVVSAPSVLLDEQHGRDYLTWELRGNRICVIGEGEEPPDGVASLLGVTLDENGAVVPEGTYVNRSVEAGEGPCPFISETGRADPAGDD